MNYTSTQLSLLPVHTKHGLCFTADGPWIHCYIVNNHPSQQTKCLDGDQSKASGEQRGTSYNCVYPSVSPQCSQDMQRGCGRLTLTYSEPPVESSLLNDGLA